LAPIHPPLWSLSPVLQLVSEPIWSPVGFNRLCDLKATWRKVLSSLSFSMVRISVTGKIELATLLSQGHAIWEIVDEAYVIPATLDNATQGELQRYENNYKALNLVTTWNILMNSWMWWCFSFIPIILIPPLIITLLLALIIWVNIFS
jgi:hypothetical protein